MRLRIAEFLIAAMLCSAAAGGAELPRNGDYLSEAYLAALDKTKSHSRAWDAGHSYAPQAIRISRDKRGLVLFLGYNWHEGNEIALDPKNLPASIGDDSENRKSFFAIDATHFKFQDGTAPLTAYRYVGNEQIFLMGKLLAGTYADADGKRYVFGRSGKAQFPGRTFRYEIYTDMVFEDGDLFVDRNASTPGNWKLYGFAWKGDTLFLYNADCDVKDQPGCVIDRKQPLAVLHKVSTK